MAHYRASSWKELLVTYVKSEGMLLKFWGLPTDAVEIVKTFESHFQKATPELDSQSGYIRSDQIPRGFSCAAKSKVRHQWCRAVVLSPISISEIVVQLIDYGTVEQISVADVRKLDESFFRYAAQAIECILGDVVPANGSQWSIEAIKFCEEELLHKTMSCLIISYYSNIPITRIAKKGESEPFVQRLINNGLALIKPENPKMMSHNVAPAVAYKMNYLNPNSVHYVKVSFFESSQKFYVQLVAAELELTNLMEDIRLFTSRIENLCLVNAPHINTPCLAELQDYYCRGLITSVSQGQCIVSYVDYGCTKVKEFQELRALPPHFLKLHAQAICCTLPREIQISSEEFLKIVSKFSALECHVLGRIEEAYVVQLKFEGQDIIMPQRFITLNKPLSNQSLHYKQQKLAVSKEHEVTISYTNDIAEFYCQLVQSKQQLDSIFSLLNSRLELPSITLPECVPNLPVVVKFSEDNVWYRAQIVKVNHEHDIEVFFVDYGNYDNATLRDIRRINPELLNFPIQALKCNLYNVELLTDSSLKDEMLDFFEETTANQNLQAHVKEISEDSTGISYSVILLEKTSSLSVNDKIENKFTSISSIPVFDTEILYITNFVSLDSFFGQFEKLNSTKLEEMQAEINIYYKNCQTKFKPKCGAFVAAKYVGDGQYYRARVEYCSDSNCNVFFIDYGNRESIPLEDIQPLNRKFLKSPQFGIECALESYPPAAPIDKLNSLMPESTIKAKMIKEENKKWLVTLIEDFAQNAPILEVLRQSEKFVPRSIHGTGLRGFQDDVSKNTAEHSRPYKKDFKNARNEYSAPTRFSGDRVQNNNSNENVLPSQVENRNTFIANPKDYSKITISPNAYRNVCVSHVISPSEFYCQIEEESTKLQVLMQNIETAYTNVLDNELNLNEMKVGTPCCAIFQVDGAWYRGYIKEANFRECCIYFVDYGNTDFVPVTKIKMLKPELLELPPQALKCKLYNATTQSGKWSDKAIQDFIKLTLDKSFVAQFVEADNTNTYAVNLVSLNKLKDEVLNKQFVNLGHGQLQDTKKILVLNSHAASNNLSFQQPEIKLGSFESVFVRYGLNPQEIFCQLKSYEKEFKKLMENMQKYYNELSPSEAIVDRPHIDMICVAQFYLDSAWYRGKIAKVDKNSITVLYVDYGNSESVDKKKIRCIAQDFTDLPVQGIKCRIKGIAPPGDSWPLNSNISKYFEGDAECEFVSKEDDCYIINLTCNQKNVAQQLIKDGLAVGDAPARNIEPVVNSETIKSISKSQLPIQTLPKRIEVVPGQLLSVTVSYTESPYRFWCQSLDDSDTIEQLMADIQKRIEQGITLIEVNELAVGLYCLAKYSEDESWYRAQIKSCNSGNGCEVFFIDYGNTEATAFDKIAVLPLEFQKIHQLCFECQLRGASASCTSEKIDVFQAIIDESGEDMTAKVEKVSGEVCIITLLYEVEDVEKNANEVLFGSEIVNLPTTEILKFLPPDVPLGLQEGYVTIVNSPHDFFIQLAGCEDNLFELATNLSEICESIVQGDDLFESFSIGGACAAKFSEDNSWYRAEIIDLQENSADVLFVDYGNTNNVSKEDLRALDGKFLTAPPYAIRCKLNGIIPSSEQWSESATNTFQDLVNNALLGITFICKDLPAVVNVCKEDKDIGQSLIDLELACVDTCTETNEAYADDHLSAPIEDQLHSLPFDQSYPKRKLISTKLPIKICYVDSYNKFYIMPIELSTELDTVMKTLEILYSQSSDESVNQSQQHSVDLLEDPRSMLPCVAKYSEDEAWYRALITDIEGDNIYVTFVDYGNSEVSSLKNLKPLTPELLKIPPIAMECSLYAIQAVEGKEQELTSKLEEYFVDEVELEMEVYKPEEPYKIRLYQGDCDIAEMLCQEGLAKEIIPPLETEDVKLNDSNNLTDDLKESLQTTSDDNSEFSPLIKPCVIDQLDEISVSVKHCEIVDDKIVLYGVPVNLEDKLESLQEKLQNVCNENPLSLPEIMVSGFCVAKYIEDESWYRAQILSCSNEEIKVQFIDYGNSEIVSSDDLKELTAEFINEPQFSIKFSPSGIKVEKTDDAQNKLNEFLFNVPVNLHLCRFSHQLNDLCFTSLVCEVGDLLETLVNEKIISQVFTLSTDLGNNFEATVESFNESVFYVLPVKLAKKRNDLQSNLIKKCCNIPPINEEINPSRLYAANIDGKWYRTSVINISDSGAVLRCVDFGIDVTVESSQITILPKEFCHESLFLQPCIIKDYELRSQEFQQKLLQGIESKEVYHFEIEMSQSHHLLVKLIEDNIIEPCESNSELSCEIAKEEDFIMESTCSEGMDIPVRLEKHNEENIEMNNSSYHNQTFENSPSVEENVESELIDINTNSMSALIAEPLKKHSKENIEMPSSSDHKQTSEYFEDVGEKVESELIGISTNSTSDLISNVKEEFYEIPSKEENFGEYSDVEAEIGESNIQANYPNDSNENLEYKINCAEDNEEDEKNIVDNKDCLQDEFEQEELLDDKKSNDSSDDSTKDFNVENIQNKSLLIHDEFQLNAGEKRNIKISSNEEISKSLDTGEDKETINCQEAHDCQSSGKWETEPSCSENENSKSVESLSEHDRLELSDVESEETNGKMNASNSQDYSSESSKDDKITYDNDLNDLSQQLKNTCLEQAIDEVVEEAISDIKSELEQQTAQVHVDEANQEELGDVSVDINDIANLLSTGKATIEENNFDERPECDIKQELTSELVSSSVDNQLSAENSEENVLSVIKIEELSFPEENETTESSNTAVECQTTLTSNVDNAKAECELGCEAECDVTLVEQHSTVAETSLDDQLSELALNELHQLTNTNVTISHVAVSDGSVIFPVTPKNLFPKLSQLKGILQSIYSVDQPPVSNVVVSELYAVLCNGEWHRGKILDTKDGSITVILIDTGLCNTIDLSDVRQLKDPLKTVPPFAFWCVLATAYCPPENKEFLTLFLEEMLTNASTTKQDVTIKVVQEEEPYKVNLYIEDIDLLSILLSEKQVIQQLPTAVVSSGKHLGKISHLQKLKSGNVGVYINLVLQLDNLNKLRNSMQLAYKLDSSNLPVVETGVYAVQHNGNWARGKAVCTGGSLSLFLVDSGKDIAVSNAYSLLPEHCLQPPYSILCELDIENTNVEGDVSSVVDVLKEEEFNIFIETDSKNNIIAKVVDEHFPQRLKELLPHTQQ